MTTPTDTNRDLLTVIARMRAKSGKEQELREALEALIEPTSKEKGYVNYDLHQGVEDSRWFFFYENWDSVEDHTVRFRGSLDFQQWRRLVGPHFAGPPVVEHTQCVIHGLKIGTPSAPNTDRPAHRESPSSRSERQAALASRE